HIVPGQCAYPVRRHSGRNRRKRKRALPVLRRLLPPRSSVDDEKIARHFRCAPHNVADSAHLPKRSVACESAGDSTDGEQPDERDESNQLGAYFLCRKAAPEEESLSAHRLHASVLRFSDTSTPAICKTERHRAGSSGAGSPGFVRHKTSASARPNQNGSPVPGPGSFTHTKVPCKSKLEKSQGIPENSSGNSPFFVKTQFGFTSKRSLTSSAPACEVRYRSATR